METTNKLTVTRKTINRVINDLKKQLSFQTGTIEADLGRSCSVFVDTKCRDNGWYRELELVTIEMIKDGVSSDDPYPNIASYIFRALSIEVVKMNATEYQSEIDFLYQQEYEATSGKYFC